MTLIIQKPTGAKLVLAKDYIPVDPDFANVSLLLHGDGTNGSTTITDSSPTPKTVTAEGNAQISTVQSKFGGASIAFDGTGDYLTVPSSPEFAFGTQDFTVEAWVYFGNLTAFSSIASSRTSGSSTLTGWTVGINANEVPYFYTNSFNIQGSALSQNTWHHIAVTRSGTSLKMFVNGTQEGGTATDSKDYTNQTFAVGAAIDGAQVFNGYIDDLRITKGVARYSANFTPPTAPFPDIVSR
jgi:hypothetical protein